MFGHGIFQHLNYNYLFETREAVVLIMRVLEIQRKAIVTIYGTINILSNNINNFVQNVVTL